MTKPFDLNGALSFALGYYVFGPLFWGAVDASPTTDQAWVMGTIGVVVTLAWGLLFGWLDTRKLAQ
jgi:hypothetical protein